MNRRITKGQIASAQSELECIRGLATEADSRHACLAFHAASALRHVAVLAGSKTTLPDWLVRDWNYFKSLGWIPTNLTKPESVA